MDPTHRSSCFLSFSTAPVENTLLASLVLSMTTDCVPIFASNWRRLDQTRLTVGSKLLVHLPSPMTLPSYQLWHLARFIVGLQLHVFFSSLMMIRFPPIYSLS